jgi:chemotaxis protein MotB
MDDSGIDMEASGGDDWLTTYADAITLLLAFFVMILGTATLDKAKYDELRESIQGAINHEEIAPQKTQPAEKPPETVVAQEIETAVKKAKDDGRIKVTVADDLLTVEFNAVGMFKKGKATIASAEMLNVVREVGFAIRTATNRASGEHQGKIPYVDVEGHSDNQPLGRGGRCGGGKFCSNWELSAARASSVIRELRKQKFMPSSNLRAIGLADTRPKVTYGTLTGEALERVRQENRRVVLKVRWVPQGKTHGHD